jgi:hypothetical protein
MEVIPEVNLYGFGALFDLEARRMRELSEEVIDLI